LPITQLPISVAHAGGGASLRVFWPAQVRHGVGAREVAARVEALHERVVLLVAVGHVAVVFARFHQHLVVFALRQYTVRIIQARISYHSKVYKLEREFSLLKSYAVGMLNFTLL